MPILVPPSPFLHLPNTPDRRNGHLEGSPIIPWERKKDFYACLFDGAGRGREGEAEDFCVTWTNVVFVNKNMNISLSLFLVGVSSSWGHARLPLFSRTCCTPVNLTEKGRGWWLGSNSIYSTNNNCRNMGKPSDGTGWVSNYGRWRTVQTGGQKTGGVYSCNSSFAVRRNNNDPAAVKNVANHYFSAQNRIFNYVFLVGYGLWRVFFKENANREWTWGTKTFFLMPCFWQPRDKICQTFSSSVKY